MKQLKTKKRRSSWLHFAITGAVLFGLSLGISQMLPKSHPIRALRGLSGGSNSDSKPFEVQGAPFAVAGAITDSAALADKTRLKPEIGTSTQPDSTPVSPMPEVGGERGRKRTGAYQSLTFEALTSFRIKEPNWGRMDDPAYIATLNLDKGIPLQIKTLNGAKIEIEGFMLPLEGEVDDLRTFMLLKDQMACCFGAIPLLNEWVYVKVPKNKRISSYQDELVTLYGTLCVGARFEDDTLTGIYHLELDRLEADALTLDRF